MRLIFMGTPEFSVPTLTSLIDSQHEVVAVYTQPPRPAGRGKKLTPSPIHKLAESHNLPVFTPTSLRKEDVAQQFSAHGADATIVIAYGLLLPQPILHACPLGCLNVHPSALPRWRGAAPIQRTIIEGDEYTELCIMHMDIGLDSGPVYSRTPITIPADMTAGKLHDMCAEMAGGKILETLAAITTHKLKPLPQVEENVTYAHKITKEDRKIDWNQPAETIYNQIRGLAPYPGAYFSYNNEDIKVFSAEIIENIPDNISGIALDSQLTIACGTSALRLTELQRPGKKRMPASELLKSFSLPIHSSLTSNP